VGRRLKSSDTVFSFQECPQVPRSVWEAVGRGGSPNKDLIHDISVLAKTPHRFLHGRKTASKITGERGPMEQLLGPLG